MACNLRYESGDAGEKMKDAVLTAASSVVTGAIDFLVKCNAVDEQKKETLKMKLVNEQKDKELKFKAEAGDGGSYVRPRFRLPRR